jgi:uncharacterized Zn finger protein
LTIAARDGVVPGVVDRGIANILHRETIAVIVGTRTFERGEQCFIKGRVIRVDAVRGELRGTVKPQEPGRRDYATRIWVREEGLAYECSCPMGQQQQFCKHAVAVALAHLETERREAERELSTLRRRLDAIGPAVLVDRLVDRAKTDAALLDALKRICAGTGL